MKNLFDKLTFYFAKDREFRTALYKLMGFYPHNVELYRVAFAHKSQEYRSRKHSGKSFNNERLEFLGDAVLETVVSDILYQQFPHKREGFLTNTRSKIVSRESLGKIAKELGIERFLQSHTTGKQQKSYLAGNSFEALVGAIYLDRGFKHAYRFVEKRIFGKLLDLKRIAAKEVNFKSKLLEWGQKNRIRIEFKEKTSNTDEGTLFLTTVIIEGLYAGEGKGFTKKDSHQAATKEVLTRLRTEELFHENVYLAKEKRTAMGADECFVVPKIAEIEEEIQQAQLESKQKKKEAKAKKKKENTANSHLTLATAESTPTNDKSSQPKERTSGAFAEETTETTNKKQRGRRGKKTSSADFVNTEPVLAEESKRAQKAERKQREEKHKRQLEKSQQQLLEEGDYGRPELPLAPTTAMTSTQEDKDLSPRVVEQGKDSSAPPVEKNKETTSKFVGIGEQPSPAPTKEQTPSADHDEPKTLLEETVPVPLKEAISETEEKLGQPTTAAEQTECPRESHKISKNEEALEDTLEADIQSHSANETEKLRTEIAEAMEEQTVQNITYDTTAPKTETIATETAETVPELVDISHLRMAYRHPRDYKKTPRHRSDRRGMRAKQEASKEGGKTERQINSTTIEPLTAVPVVTKVARPRKRPQYRKGRNNSKRTQPIAKQNKAVQGNAEA